MLRSLGCLSKTSTGHHGLKFLEGLFRNEKLSTSHKTKTENSLALSFAIFVFQRCIFSLKIQNVGLENHLIVRARQPFCWKWISLLKPFKNMPRVMLRSLSTQILIGPFFWSLLQNPPLYGRRRGIHVRKKSRLSCFPAKIWFTRSWKSRSLVVLVSLVFSILSLRKNLCTSDVTW